MTKQADVKVISQASTGSDHLPIGAKPSAFKPLPKYDGPNPFGRRIKPGWLDRIQLVFFTVTLIGPLRWLICLMLFLLMAGVATLVTCGADKTKPLSRCRRTGTYIMRGIVRVFLFVAGFWWVSRRGRRDSSARMIVANHVTFFDAFYLYYLTGCAEAAKAELFAIPVVGSILRAKQCVAIKRESAEGRQKARDELRERCLNEAWPPLLVFPQGTTTREDTLTTFKSGAFEAGSTVQPVCIKFGSPCNSLEFLYGIPWTLYETCCQFVNFHRVIWLDPVAPDDEEKANPGAFAERVRSEMAEALGAELTPHSYDDVRLRCALGKKIGVKDPDFMMGDVFDSYSIPTSKVIALIDVYKVFDKDSNGVIDFHDFCQNTGLPLDSQVAQRLFKLFDMKDSGVIDFESFVLSIFVVTTEGHDREMMKVLWTLVQTPDGSGFDSSADFLDQAGCVQLSSQMREISKRVPNKQGTFDELVWQLNGFLPDVRAFLTGLYCSRITGLKEIL